MKILYISQYYPPEMGAPAARVSELARQWQRRGHEVTVLTAFPHHPHGTKRPEDRGVLTRRESDQGIDIVRTYVYAARNSGFLLRIVSYLSFMISAIVIGTFRVGKPDVVIATSPQFFTAIAGWWMALVKRVPFVFEVRDLWPESIVTVGAMRDSLAIRQLKRTAAWLYETCDQLVTVGDGYRRRIVDTYGVSESKIEVVTNGVDLKLFQHDEQARQEIRTKHGWQDQCVALYLGTHGMAHALDSVLRSAKELAGKAPVRFVFVGDGAEKPKLLQMAAELGLDNVEFLPPVQKDLVVKYYAAADLCLVPLRKVDLFTDVLPSKLFEIMGMSKPIVLSVDGEARKVVEQAEAGVFVEPENHVALAETLVRLHQAADERTRMGVSGRRFVERYYDRNVLADNYLSLLNWVVQPQTAPITLEPRPAAEVGRQAA